MSSSHYGYGEEPENPDRIELARRSKKNLGIDPTGTTTSWRDNGNYIDPDSTSKILTSTYKQARNDSLKKPLTQQQISDRVARQEIIQQSVKAGTYDNPDQPWNRRKRWIEDGGK